MPAPFAPAGCSGALPQAFVQLLMLFMQGEQPLAQRPRLRLLRHRRRDFLCGQ
ncbi:hypothetical protein LNO36_05990 [Klebsiella variicola subsp. variicola]|nr:hypothetical protein [Klebsiella variicola subsp. variicola]